jgi:carbamoyl-phosphate synthase small subunit
MSVMNINDWLIQQNVPGIYNVDTRAITKKIRKDGTVKCLLSTEGISRDEAERRLTETPLRGDYMKETGTKEIRRFPGSGLRVAILDFGIKRGILDAIRNRGCDITLFPYSTEAAEILAAVPDGLLLSNGPGDPAEATSAIDTTKKLMGKLPIFGICMGHQILGLAAGGQTYKLKFGHRGGNHGVLDMETGRSAITSQNHSYAIDGTSIANRSMVVTHVNLNDGTVEGMRHRELPMFSVQYHPEGAPGPNDSGNLFDRFIALMEVSKGGAFHA